jgi:hypothetical protein
MRSHVRKRAKARQTEDYMNEGFLREREQAGKLGISVRTLREWRAKRLIPYFKVGRVVMFDPSRVRQAVEKFERKELA